MAAPPSRTPKHVLSGQAINATGSGSSSTLQVGANVPDTLAINFTNMQTSGPRWRWLPLGGPTGLVTTLGASGIVATSRPPTTS